MPGQGLITLQLHEGGGGDGEGEHPGTEGQSGLHLDDHCTIYGQGRTLSLVECLLTVCIVILVIYHYILSLWPT